MSLFLRTFAPLRATTSRAVQGPVAAFSTSSVRSALSESDHDHKDQPDRKAKIDEHQKDSIEQAKQGKGEWKPELASNSEQAAQADKKNMSMDEMQKMGKEKAEQGKSPSGSK